MLATLRSRALVGGLVLVAMFAVIAPKHAMAETKFGVLNFQSLMADSKAAKSIQDQLEAKRKSFQDEFSKHERELVEKEKALVDKRAEMTPEEFNKSRQDFESEVLETRKLVQKRQRALEMAAQKAVSELRVEVTRITAEIAKEKGYDMVLSRQNVVLAQEEMDITNDVLKALDKQVKEVKLVISQ